MKNKLMTKCLCVLLSVLMLLGITACGTGEETGTEAPTSGESATEAETADPRYTCDLPADLDYKGETVHILFADKVGRDDELVSDGITAGQIPEAVYSRNKVVEDDIGVTLDLIPWTELDVTPAMERDVKGGTGEYDIVVNGTYQSIQPAMSGSYLDLAKLDMVDTTKHYWAQGYNEMVTFTSDRHQFLGTGPMALSMFRLMYLTIYNKTLFEATQEKDLYEVVMNGEWTLDYQYSVLTDKYVDSDGDARKSKGDTYGFVTGNCVSADPYAVAGDAHLVVKDADTGDMIFNQDAVSRLSDVTDKTQLLYNSASTYVFQSSTEDDVGLSYIVDMFAEGRSLMATILFWNMESSFEELASMSYGIAPIPKLSKEQKNYGTYVQDQVSSFGVSAGVKSEERQQMLGAVLEDIAYHSYRIIRPAYYDSALSLKYMQDPASQEILDLIYDSLYFDFACNCSAALTSCMVILYLRPMFSGKKNTLTSSAKSWGKSIGRNLEQYNKKLNELG